MKHLLALCLVLIIIALGLTQPVIDPQDFAGQWYSAKDQRVYEFHKGLIYCPKYGIAISDTESVSGAYSYGRKTVFLFAKGIDGLEKEKEVYYVRSGDGSFLCENKDGTGEIYFIRYHN